MESTGFRFIDNLLAHEIEIIKNILNFRIIEYHIFHFLSLLFYRLMKIQLSGCTLTINGINLNCIFYHSANYDRRVIRKIIRLLLSREDPWCKGTKRSKVLSGQVA